MNLQERFEDFVKFTPVIPLPAKCLVISDIHAASGLRDPLVGSKVEPLLVDVLNEFNSKGYSLLTSEVVDIWRGEMLALIRRAHSHLLDVIDEYHAESRLYRVRGNHERNELDMLPEVIIFEGFGKKIFFDHGYLCDPPNDQYWFLARQLVHLASLSGVDPESSPHPENTDRHAEVQEIRHKLANDNKDWDFLWGHTHFFENIGNNHNSGSPLNGRVEGYVIEEGEIKPLERRNS